MLKIKVYLSVFLLTAAFLAVVVWRFESIERQKTLSFIEAQSQVVLAGLSQTLKTEFKKWAYSQSFSTSTLQGLKAKGYFVAHQDADKRFAFDRTESFIGDEQTASLMKYFETRFARLQASAKQLQPEESFIFEPTTLKKKDDGAPLKLISLAFRANNQLVGILLDAQVFQAHLDMFKSADGQMTIVDDNQMILAQSEEDYFGTKAAGLESSSDKEFVLSNPIPQTNLNVVYKASYAKVFAQRSMSWLQFIVIGLGFLFVCLGALSFLLSSKENREDQLSEQNALLRQDVERLKVEAVKLKQLEAKSSGPVPVAVQEKIDQAKNTLSSLALEMNPHMLALVGLANRLQSPLSFQDAAKLGQSLNAEIQKARSLIMKIFEYTGVATSEEKTIASLDLPLQEALRNLKPLLDKHEVQVSKDVQSKATVKMTVKHLVRAISELIENSIDAMERMPNKKISIVVDDQGETVRMTVKDNGEGIAQGVREKIFEPFFTTRGFKNKKGLGLSAVMGILKEHGAECTVRSDLGKGCEFVMVFKKDIETKAEVPVTQPKTLAPQPEVAAQVDVPQAPQERLDLDAFENSGIIRRGTEVPTAPAPQKQAPALTPIQKVTQETNQLHDEIVTMALQKAKAEKNQMREAQHVAVEVVSPPPVAREADPDLEDLLSVPDADSSVVVKPVVAHHIGRPQFKKKRTESVLSEFAAPKIPQTSLPKEVE